MRILVCGGAGYIGSHMVWMLEEKGHDVIVVDNFEKGHRSAIPPNIQVFEGDLRDIEFIRGVFKSNCIDAVIHFAAYSLVGESMKEPLLYYENNVLGSMNLFKAMNEFDVRYIVFSSTASVYGIADIIPITTNAPTKPINTYGESKLAVENLLVRCDEAYGIKSACLRYFNVAGARPGGDIGEDHYPESHIIPNILLSLINHTQFTLFGNDYNTPDGTCIRDYIHVCDLCEAHLLSLESIMQRNQSAIYNLGSETGYSNLELIHAAEEVTGLKVDYKISQRRPGDPDILVASSQLTTKEIGWKPRLRLKEMIASAYDWHSKHPKGYN